jgi:hypothetical protein
MYDAAEPGSEAKLERMAFRVDAQTRATIDALAKRYRASRSYVMRLAVADLARRAGVRADDPAVPLPPDVADEEGSHPG